jgi:hypothetical protein
MTSARRRHLRILRFYIILPAYPAGLRKLFERHGDRMANDEAFSAAIHHSSESPSFGRTKAAIGPDTLFSFTSIISTLQQIIASLAVHMNQRKRKSTLNMVDLVCETGTRTLVFSFESYEATYP